MIWFICFPWVIFSANQTFLCCIVVLKCSYILHVKSLIHDVNYLQNILEVIETTSKSNENEIQWKRNWNEIEVNWNKIQEGAYTENTEHDFDNAFFNPSNFYNHTLIAFWIWNKSYSMLQITLAQCHLTHCHNDIFNLFWLKAALKPIIRDADTRILRIRTPLKILPVRICGC